MPGVGFVDVQFWDGDVWFEALEYCVGHYVGAGEVGGTPEAAAGCAVVVYGLGLFFGEAEADEVFDADGVGVEAEVFDLAGCPAYLLDLFGVGCVAADDDGSAFGGGIFLAAAASLVAASFLAVIAHAAVSGVSAFRKQPGGQGFIDDIDGVGGVA